MRNITTIALLLSLALPCNEGEVELWGVCYSIEETDTLDLSWNQLGGGIPSEIGDLINLTYLQLDGNQFMGQIPSIIGNLINLYLLDLQNNQLSGEIPIEICNPSIVHLDNNQLCPSYPECLCVSCIGYQDTSNCP